MKSQPVKASPGDVLKVPKLNFDITRRYSELESLRLLSKNPAVAKDLMILSAVQNTRFQLDEKGVRLRSESHLTFGCAAEFEPPPTHVMVRGPSSCKLNLWKHRFPPGPDSIESIHLPHN